MNSTRLNNFQHDGSTSFNWFQPAIQRLSMLRKVIAINSPIFPPQLARYSLTQLICIGLNWRRMDSETRNERRGGGRAYRSRLESFVDFIHEQRRHRKTWQEIATLLRTEKDCAITFQGLHQFYRRYLKRQAKPHWEDGAVMSLPATLEPPAPAHKPMLAATPTSRSYRQPSPHNIKLNDPTKL